MTQHAGARGMRFATAVFTREPTKRAMLYTHNALSSAA